MSAPFLLSPSLADAPRVAPSAIESFADVPRVETRLPACLAALGRAFDLAAGQTPGHAVRTSWIAQRLGCAIGLDSSQRRRLLFITLLQDAGAGADATRLAALVEGDDLDWKQAACRRGALRAPSAWFVAGHAATGAGPLRRLRAVLRLLRHRPAIAAELTACRQEAGARFARALDLGEGVVAALAAIDERWDGRGRPGGLSGDRIPLEARVARLAQVAAGGPAGRGMASVRQEVARRGGSDLDPRLADAFAVLARDPAFADELALEADALEPRLLALEAAHHARALDESGLDRFAAAAGALSDSKCRFMQGHSTRVAEIADGIAEGLALAADRRRWLRRGALLHDIGRLGIGNGALDHPGPLDDWQQAAVRRQPMLGEKILARLPAFGVLARIVGAQRERLDGAGYPRGLDARHLRQETRILATADLFDALTQPRSWRPAFSGVEALATLRRGVGTQVDERCLSALAAWLAGRQAV